MAQGVNRGDIWLYDFRAPDKRRPVVVLTRDDVIELIQTVMVAPITSTIRGAPSEVLIGPEQGLKHPSAINLDFVQTIDRARLRRYVGHLSPAKMRDLCRALAIAVGCEP
ncbi:MAG: type II toxin-antitoxin system PemK/MazF family toxin [Deltaproteobacteria bacterium]|nr:type II toxin-antitoxin system PemK/MazF family toxin [Deltaproteobacteria bacterium]